MNTEELAIRREIHLHSTDDKLKWWGYGEWVEELDFMEFTYKEIDCRIGRVAYPENPPYIFGGYFCGYIRIPHTHPYHHKKYEDMEIDCHQGLTYGEVSNGHWIGFDCGHFNDIIPSREVQKKTNPVIKKMFDESEVIFKKYIINPDSIFKKTYKNMDFCIKQCIHIADQLLNITEKKQSN